MSFRRQPTNKLERCPWLRMKLLASEMQVQILSIQRDTTLHHVIANILPWNCVWISNLPRKWRECTCLLSALTNAHVGLLIIQARWSAQLCHVLLWFPCPIKYDGFLIWDHIANVGLLLVVWAVFPVFLRLSSVLARDTALTSLWILFSMTVHCHLRSTDSSAHHLLLQLQ